MFGLAACGELQPAGKSGDEQSDLWGEGWGSTTGLGTSANDAVMGDKTSPASPAPTCQPSSAQRWDGVIKGRLCRDGDAPRPACERRSCRPSAAYGASPCFLCTERRGISGAETPRLSPAQLQFILNSFVCKQIQTALSGAGLETVPASLLLSLYHI